MAGERGPPGPKRGQRKPKDAKGKFDQSEDDVEVKPLKEARADAEKRLRGIVDRRNALNDEARQAREGRDSINAERQRVYNEVRDLLDKRAASAQQIKAFKAERNESQAKAKQLIAMKQAKKQGATGGAAGMVKELEAQIKALEFKQQSTALAPKEELKVIEEIRKKAKELEESKKVWAEQKAMFGELKDLDEAINAWFQKADTAHAEVVRLSNEWQALTDKLEPQLKEMGHLKGQADKNHMQFVELRKRADEQHAKATELRDEVDAKHNEVRQVYQERKEVIREHRKSVREALEDPNKIDETVDEAVKLLLEKGKISL